jgi:hypothetical protein
MGICSSVLGSHLEKVDLESWTTSAKQRATSVFAAQSQNLLNMVRIYNPLDWSMGNWNKTVDELATPPYYTCFMEAFKLVSLLIDGGAEVNELLGARFLSGTALATTVSTGHQPTVKLFIENGADVNAQGSVYGNALQSAVSRGNKDVVQLLLDKGADVNALGGKYGTALQAAVLVENKDMVQLLLDKGADVNVQGVKREHYQHESALQAALAKDKFEIAKVLLARGAKLDPSGGGWEEFLARVEKNRGVAEANRLRKYQENPNGYIEWRRQQKLEGLDEDPWDQGVGFATGGEFPLHNFAEDEIEWVEDGQVEADFGEEEFSEDEDD